MFFLTPLLSCFDQFFCALDDYDKGVFGFRKRVGTFVLVRCDVLQVCIEYRPVGETIKTLFCRSVLALRPSMNNSDRAASTDLPRSLPEEHCGYLLPLASESPTFSGK